jgi:hypothetical protein
MTLGRVSVSRTVAVLSVSVFALGACSSSSKKTSSSSNASPSTTSVPVVPKRWWTDVAGSSGSTIDTANPTAAAASLKPDLPTYCKVLSDTVASHNVFQSASGTDPGVVTATKAWIAEISALAPTEVSQAWQTYGNGINALLEMGTKKSGAAFPSLPGDWSAAEAKINAHAKSACNVTLTSSSGASAAPTASQPSHK